MYFDNVYFLININIYEGFYWFKGKIRVYAKVALQYYANNL